MKLRVYVDTSVFSAYCDERAPDRKALTEAFWQSRLAYDCATSTLSVEELRQTSDPILRAKMEALLAGFEIVTITEAMRELADGYLAAAAFSRAMYNDALHVAAATLTRQDVLISWNFKHLVNRRRRAVVQSVNLARGLLSIDILSPPEL